MTVLQLQVPIRREFKEVHLIVGEIGKDQCLITNGVEKEGVWNITK